MSKLLPAQIAKRHKLSPQLIAFVEALLSNGGDVTKAVIATGYRGKNPRAQGSKWWRAEGVREAYNAAIYDKIAMSANGAVNSLITLSQSAESEHAMILAAEKLIKLAGLDAQETAAQGNITINIGLRDTDATQQQTIDGQSLDITEINEHE